MKTANQQARQVSRRGALRLAGAAALAGGVLAGTAGTPPASAAPGQEVVGSWTGTDGPLGSRLVTYISDGGFIGALAQGTTHSPQHGVWISTGNLQFAVRSLSFHLDATGAVIGLYDLRTNITVDPSGNSYSGSLVQYEYDETGAQVDVQNATVQATRILPMPM